MTRTSMLGIAAGAALAIGLGGWAAAGALQPSAPAPAADDLRPRGLQVRYEVRREAPYVAPPATEATRLDVLSVAPPTVVGDGVLSAQAAEAFRSLQADDAARTAATLTAVRAEDVSIDRRTASAPEGDRSATDAPPEAPSPAVPAKITI